MEVKESTEKVGKRASRRRQPRGLSLKRYFTTAGVDPADEIAWVQTSYLIAEVVMIPLSGFLSRALGIRMLFVLSCALFTAASLVCAMS